VNGVRRVLFAGGAGGDALRAALCIGGCGRWTLVLEVPEVMRCVLLCMLLCMLEAVEGGMCLPRGVGGAGGNVLCAALFGGCGGWAQFRYRNFYCCSFLRHQGLSEVEQQVDELVDVDLARFDSRASNFVTFDEVAWDP
jgi:hypothetical protein